MALATLNASHVEGFAETLAVHPSDEVPNLESRVLDADSHAVLRPRPGEGKQVPARPEAFHCAAPQVHGRHVVVPALAHEGQPIGRVRDDGLNKPNVGQGFHGVGEVQADVLDGEGWGHSRIARFPGLGWT